MRDSYVFKSLTSDTDSSTVTLEQELFKLRAYGDYSPQAMYDDMRDQFVSVGTLNQIETFHRYLFNDLFKEEKSMKMEKQVSPTEKRYYVVPLKLAR